MLIDCESLKIYRDRNNLGPFIKDQRRIHPSVSSIKLYCQFLNDKDPKVIQDRAIDLYQMKAAWHNLMNIDL